METINEDGEIIAGLPAERVETGLVVALTKAEIDQQIATAHAFPRSIDRARKNILSLVTLDEESAAESIYALPRGGKPIKGPSIRLAEIVAGQWGNCRVAARVVQVDRTEKFVEAEGVFHDLETNTAVSARVRRRIVDSKGRLFNDDMIVVTGNAACSIAKRNAILAGIPKPAWRPAYEAAERVVAGDVKTLATRREAALKAFAVFGVKPEQVFAAIGVRGLDDVTLEHMPSLVGMHAALKAGDVTVEEMFNPRATAAGAQFERIRNPLADEPRQVEAPKDPPAKAEASPPPEPSGNSAPGEQPAPAAGAPDHEAAGRAARKAGMSRRAVPAEIRNDEAAVAAWLAGYDAAKAEEESRS